MGFDNLFRGSTTHLGSNSTCHFDDRIQRSYPRPMLGEYAPWMAADLLRATNHDRLLKLSVGWQQLCWGVLILDDIIDLAPCAHTSMLLMGSHLLNQRGICAML